VWRPRPGTTQQLRAGAYDAIAHHFGEDPDSAEVKAMLASVTFISGDYRDAGTFERLAEALAGAERPLPNHATPVLALVTMGPPVAADAQSLGDQKV